MPYLNQTYFDIAIKELLDSFNDNNSKQDAKFKEIIHEQDANIDAIREKQIQTFLLHIQKESIKKSSTLHAQLKKTIFFHNNLQWNPQENDF